FTIPAIRPVNAQGVSSFAGNYIRLNGTVGTENQAPYDKFYLTQLGAGLQIFNPFDSLNYQPSPGDSLRVVGLLEQNFGQLRLNLDSLSILATQRDLPTPVPGIVEENEGYLAFVDSVSLGAGANWSPRNFLGFTVPVSNNQTDFELLIGSETELLNLPAPQGRFRVRGYLDQFDESLPWRNTYLLRPQSRQDILLYIEPKVNAAVNQVCVGDSLTLTATTLGFAGQDPIYSWLRNDSTVAQTQLPTVRIPVFSQLDVFRVQVRANGGLTYAYVAPDNTEQSPPLEIQLLSRPRVLTFTNTLPTIEGQEIRLIASATGGGQLQFFDAAGNLVPGGRITNPTISNSGRYFAVAVGTNGCSSDTASLDLVVSPISSLIENAADFGIGLFPNPVEASTPFQLSFTQPLGVL
ncbi:MAG: hypothetical protein HC821_02915, partial [Lewinella sp.]|nr:hypothetical protein [Lewinella sp.]